MHPCFVISKFDFNKNDLNNLLYFYYPIIGSQCSTLFRYLLSIKNVDETVDYEFLEKIFEINFENFNKNREILESLNLIETFYDSEQKKYFINLKAPLNSNQIDKNPYLKSLIVQKITLSTYTNLIQKFKNTQKISKNKQIDTLNLRNLSKKFYELFELNSEKINNLLTFPEDFDNKKAKKGLDFEDYHLYLAKKIIRPRVRNALKAYQNERNFSNYAINCVIDYCYKTNNQIIFNYMKKILDDLWDNKIINGKDVEIELKEIFKQKQKNSQKLLILKNKNNLVYIEDEKQLEKNSKVSNLETKNNLGEIDWIVDELNSGEGWL
ncbi:chromosome replication initiation protein [Mesomycoplasma hyopneumoniae]|uniref:Replicative helicase loading/DNA remodeling protein DnaB N-terminal winged helix domain-containing protein n=2 Tax=Mesomycoplasma hyopneumoniae (strain 168) TaxID=907287 RepID=E4QT27_MESH1|nr:DnaD domain protein [Mesomycoplasma hyopneumoniae]ADQ90579.1 Putative uncharacterized protein [Mesomycoplasma hyopneumoniae 168]AGM22153.1 hypothetical protein MHP168L_375 [Mesomycoplasma hyopneumoniae 168-L]OWY74147.1 chromosome replication initiation protein [Mesomycoplasma hyopneumoniae]